MLLRSTRRRYVDHPTMAAILDNKNQSAPSVFTAAALLREARRQKGLPLVDVPALCVLDPDGDIVRALRKQKASKPFLGWACYHTEMDTFDLAGQTVGIVGCAVGAPFAVLVAEELFASGCRFVLSLTSSGQIMSASATPYFIIIDRALRDEGTSYHYAAPSEFAMADSDLVSLAAEAVKPLQQRTLVGATWTTDAPFRETAEAIQAAKELQILAVEMEAAALYAFAAARQGPLLCLAHVTNTMAQNGEDFEKGEDAGTKDALAVLGTITHALGVANKL